MNTTQYPDDNPKSAVGSAKVPLHLVPPSAMHYLATAFADGAAKYGPYNWREKSVAASVYIAAMKRHIDDWWDGEDLSEDAKVEHLAHAMACAAIILDAASIGKLVDDRPAKGAASRLQKDYASNAAVIGVGQVVPVERILQQPAQVADSWDSVENSARNYRLVHTPKTERKIPFLERFMKR